MTKKSTLGTTQSKAEVPSDSPQTAVMPPQLLSRLLGNAGLLSNDQAASYIGVTPGTLEVWRCTKRHQIPYIKVGRLVKYRREVLEDFLTAQTVMG